MASDRDVNSVRRQISVRLQCDAWRPLVGRVTPCAPWLVDPIGGQRTARPAEPSGNYVSCRAMLAPTQVFSMLKSTPIILP